LLPSSWGGDSLIKGYTFLAWCVVEPRGNLNVSSSLTAEGALPFPAGNAWPLPSGLRPRQLDIADKAFSVIILFLPELTVSLKQFPRYEGITKSSRNGTALCH
jgi:hypothetical protein